MLTCIYSSVISESIIPQLLFIRKKFPNGNDLIKTNTFILLGTFMRIAGMTQQIDLPFPNYVRCTNSKFNIHLFFKNLIYET